MKLPVTPLCCPHLEFATLAAAVASASALNDGDYEVYTWYTNGSLTADGTSVYPYDAENRLVETRRQTNSTCAEALQATLRHDPPERPTIRPVPSARAPGRVRSGR